MTTCTVDKINTKYTNRYKKVYVCCCMKKNPFVLIIHEVADYDQWKRIFDRASGIRKEAGELSYQVFQFVEDPNQVVHFSQWCSYENAKRFFESDELIRIRGKAGVKQPRFIYLDQIETGSFFENANENYVS